MRTFYATIFCISMAFAPMAVADDSGSGHIRVEQPWARASAGPAKAGAAYMTLDNMGETTDRLVRVESQLANRTEIHNHVMEDGVMRMLHVEGGIDVSPGTPIVLQPGGLHVMFMGLKKPFVEGQRLPLTLIFEKAGRIETEFVVQGVGARTPSGAGKANNHKHGS